MTEHYRAVLEDLYRQRETINQAIAGLELAMQREAGTSTTSRIERTLQPLTPAFKAIRTRGSWREGTTNRQRIYNLFAENPHRKFDVQLVREECNLTMGNSGVSSEISRLTQGGLLERLDKGVYQLNPGITRKAVETLGLIYRDPEQAEPAAPDEGGSLSGAAKEYAEVAPGLGPWPYDK